VSAVVGRGRRLSRRRRATWATTSVSATVVTVGITILGPTLGPLIRSGMLFAPARILPSTMERLHDRNHGRYVAIQLTEGSELIDTARQGSLAARHAQATLELSWRSAATTETAQTLIGGSSCQELEPATGLGGPDLF
jgi:hypothetical protein